MFPGFPVRISDMRNRFLVLSLRAWRNGSIAKPRSMLNIAIFDPWQRSLFARQQTAEKERLLARKQFLSISWFYLTTVASDCSLYC